MEEETNSLCKAHSGIMARVKTCEDNMKALWTNYNGMQKTILAVFITLALNLIGVIFVLLKTYIQG